jgi:hypothetical protein
MCVLVCKRSDTTLSCLRSEREQGIYAAITFIRTYNACTCTVGVIPPHAQEADVVSVRGQQAQLHPVQWLSVGMVHHIMLCVCT